MMTTDDDYDGAEVKGVGVPEKGAHRSFGKFETLRMSNLAIAYLSYAEQRVFHLDGFYEKKRLGTLIVKIMV